MTRDDALTAPLDDDAVRALADRGLALSLLDRSDERAAAEYDQATARGFHGPRISEDGLAALRRLREPQRALAVRDAARPDVTIATFVTFPLALTMPGPRRVDVWAVSDVTVAPTHRRRRILTTLMTAELGLARRSGFPLAALTVSEATIYRRFGFGPAAQQAGYELDTTRTLFTPPSPSARVEVVEPADLRDDALALMETVASATPGAVAVDALHLEQEIGLTPDDPGVKSVRALRAVDDEGAVIGFVVYAIQSDDSDFSHHTATVRLMAAATPDAEDALVRTLAAMDLVSRIRLPLRRTDEVLPHQVADRRAVRTTVVRDHLWLRVLDVPGALTARAWSAPGRLVLDVADTLGYADGRWLLEVDDDGDARVAPVPESAADGAAELRLDVSDLAELLLGGVSATVLTIAGRVRASRDAARAADRLFATDRAPWLGTWF